MDELTDLIDLDMEYRLTIAAHVAHDDTNCAQYFIKRREVLIPEIIETAKKKQLKPIDLFSEYARKVHVRLCEGGKL